MYAPGQISRIFGHDPKRLPSRLLDASTPSGESPIAQSGDFIVLFKHPEGIRRRMCLVENDYLSDNPQRQKPSNEGLIFPAIFRLNPEAIAVICSPLPGG
jgi:hypothetical protein